MARVPKLFKRAGSGNYYFQVRVPKDLDGQFVSATGKPQTHILRSLGTASESEAKRRFADAYAEVQAQFEERRQALDGRTARKADRAGVAPPKPAKLTPDHVYAAVVASDQAARVELWSRFEEDPDRVWTGDLIPLPDDRYTDHLKEDADNAEALFNHARKAQLKSTLALLKYARQRGDLSEFLAAADNDRTRALALLDAKAKAIEDILGGSDPATEKPAEPVRFSAAVTAWMGENRNWTPKRKAAVAACVRAFQETCGDLALGDYRKAHARDFKTALLAVPANAHKKAAYIGLSFPDIAKKAAETGEGGMSEANANKNISIMRQFWAWCSEHYDEVEANPFTVTRVRVAEKASDQRDRFSIDELKTIFNAPVYRGCKSDSRWSEAGTVVLRDSAKFWVPLLCVFTGARLNEVCQLQHSDVVQIDGDWFLRINRRTKNKDSVRDIPVHSEVIRCGFLDFVRTKKERLFDELELSADGYYSDGFSKHFARFLKSCGIKSRRNGAHSFRHTLSTTAASRGVTELQLNAITGHSNKGENARYVKDLEPASLAEAMRKIVYPGLDLSHLYV